MRISDLGEFSLIDRLKTIIDEAGAGADDIVVGIGDDAAVVRPTAAALTVLTTDLAVENIHFRLSYPSPWAPHGVALAEHIGYRAMVSNVSDIAAMAGRPRYALVTLAAPSELELESVEALYRGLARAAREYAVAIVGGDCSVSGELALGLTLIGDVEPELLRRRSDARAGDIILVTGPLGGSAAGLELLQRGPIELDDTTARRLTSLHLEPAARVHVARAAAEAGAGALEDVSDGVLAEVGHIGRASGLSAEVQAESVPVHHEVERYAQATSRDARLLALTGGEDYEPVATVSAERLESVMQAVATAGGRPAVIGRMTSGEPGRVAVLDSSGSPVELATLGYEHFHEADGPTAEAR